MTDDSKTPADDNTNAAADAQSDKGTIVATEPDTTDAGDEGQKNPAGDAEATPKGDKAEADKGQKYEGAPEDYVDFKIPEGFENLDKDLLAKATPLFKENGMSQEKAQEFVDLFADRIKSQTDSRVAAFTEVNETNKKACENHADFGGEKLKDSVVKCARAIDELMGDNAPAFREWLDSTGAGNNPFMFELLTKVGHSMTEDGMVDGDKVLPRKDIATQMYGDDGLGVASAET